MMMIWTAALKDCCETKEKTNAVNFDEDANDIINRPTR